MQLHRSLIVQAAQTGRRAFLVHTRTPAFITTQPPRHLSTTTRSTKTPNSAHNKLLRTHDCGALRAKDSGTTVTLSGWVHHAREFGGALFIALRDAHGTTQLFVNGGSGNDAHNNVMETLANLPDETVVSVCGKVQSRPDEQANAFVLTGEIEVHVDLVEIVNRATQVCALPMDSRGLDPPRHSEELRLKFRYLDLRSAYMQRNIRVRSAVTLAMRMELSNKGFTEIETPLLFKSTPEGAREFLVPTRSFPGRFYALPQSPQQYKQVLMASGFERYFQIAKCFRDEGLRADRQPEFTQLDIEMAFVDQSMVMDVIESVVIKGWEKARKVALQVAAAAGASTASKCPIPDPKLSSPEEIARYEEAVLPGPLMFPLSSTIDTIDGHIFPVMQYSEAMSRYGTDKPDTRLGLELKTVSDSARKALVASTCADLDTKTLAMHALVVPGLGATQSKKECAKMVKDAWGQLPYTPNDRMFGLVAVNVNEHGKWGRAVMQGSITKQLFAGKAPLPPSQTLARDELLAADLGARPGDLVVIAMSIGDTSKRNDHCWALGACRTSCAREAQKRGILVEPDSKDVSMLWVVNFPLFEHVENLEQDVNVQDEVLDSQAGYSLKSVHHPFTAPVEGDAHLLRDGATLQELLSVRGQHYDLVCNGVEVGGGSIRIHNSQQQRWVFESVLGLDGSQTKYFEHLLGALGSGCPNHGGVALGLDRLVMLMCDLQVIRDVIAFPKTATGQEPMTGSPGTVTEQQLAEYHISTKVNTD